MNPNYTLVIYPMLRSEKYAGPTQGIFEMPPGAIPVEITSHDGGPALLAVVSYSTLKVEYPVRLITPGSTVMVDIGKSLGAPLGVFPIQTKDGIRPMVICPELPWPTADSALADLAAEGRA